MGHVPTLCRCMCKTRGQYLPAFTLWKPFSEHLSAVCVASHDGGESAAACVHQILFPSRENWCWNVWNAASSFRTVLPKSIEGIWVVFPFQMWTPILWRPLPRQVFHLPHRGDHGTCTRNHSRWPTSDYQRCCRGSYNSIQYMPENSDWRFANEMCDGEICAPSPDDGAEGQSHINLHCLCEWTQNYPNFMSMIITGDECWINRYDPEMKQMSSQWNMSSSPWLKKVQQVKSNVKTMLIASFDIDGLVHHEYVPRGQAVNKEFYKTFLQRLRDAVRRRHTEKWRSNNWILHHDNAPAMAATTNEFLAKQHSVALTLPTSWTLLCVTSSCSHIWRKQWKVTNLITLKRFKPMWWDNWGLLWEVTTWGAFISGRNARISAYKHKDTTSKETRPTSR